MKQKIKITKKLDLKTAQRTKGNDDYFKPFPTNGKPRSYGNFTV